MAELSELSEMSPEDLMKYLLSNKREDEFKESRVREILKTDIMLTDEQLKYLYNMLECIDLVTANSSSTCMNTAKRYAKMALESDLTDRCLIANIYKILSTPQTELFFSKS